jgi:hypothetical protein
MNIMRNGSQPSTSGSSEYFTGSVRIDLSFQRGSPARVAGASVTFEPGARTAWHTHPFFTGGFAPPAPYTLARGGPFAPLRSRGLTRCARSPLIVTSGLDAYKRAGGAIEGIRPRRSGLMAAKAGTGMARPRRRR